MSTAQRLRVLPGRFAVEQHAAVPEGEFLAVVRAPDGVSVVRPAPDGAWLALYSGETAHAPDVPGMLVALLAPLAAAGVAVMVASTFTADVVLVPAERGRDAVAALRGAGHAVDEGRGNG